MAAKDQGYYRKLNQSQKEILLILYTFRFGTRELIAKSLGRQNNNAVYTKLNVLIKNGYVGRRYDKTYRLAGRPAEYFLTPQALKFLRLNGLEKVIDDKIIKNSYKDKYELSARAVRHHLDLFALVNHFVATNPGARCFTKRQLTHYNYLPQPLPDAYIVVDSGGILKRYLLEYIDHAEGYRIRRRIRQLIKYYQDDAWSVTGLPFPSILMVCKNVKIERQVKLLAVRLLNAYDEVIPLFTATLDNEYSAVQETRLTWTAVETSGGV
jgi:hypothetical protein